ncbi:MAG: DUF485 domain-containing protein [Spirochaetales bacterium]|nr:DUF485 domain-containing protein [Spirochaetales bacterium]
MAHGKSTDWGADKAIGFKTRIGIILFAVYGTVYMLFILINAINPKMMGLESLFGLNLAIVYGFGLIILAFLMGITYSIICTMKENFMNKPGSEEIK